MKPAQSLAARSRGILLGVAVGDALGWPQEQNSNIVAKDRNRHVDATQKFRAWDRYGGSQYCKYIDPVLAGSYSDDTQLTLSIGRSLQSVDWLSTLTRRELPLFLLYSRGAGGATLRACQTWAIGQEPWIDNRRQKAYFRAGGNGVAMRIAPHVIMQANRPPEELVSRIVQDGIATHGHPRALVGAAAYAVALHSLVNIEGTLEFGELPDLVNSDKSWQSPEILWANLPSSWINSASNQNSYFRNEWIDSIDETRAMVAQVKDVATTGTRGNDFSALKRFGTFDRNRNGAGTVTAAAAIYLASRYAPRPMSGLLRAAFVENADTDTLASMTGALLGALHGPEWLAIPSSQLQDREYIERMADDLTARSLGEQTSSTETTCFVDRRSIQRFKDNLQVGHSGRTVRLPDARKGILKDDFKLESRNNINAHRWIVDVEGQTLVIDRTGRMTSSKFRDSTELKTSALQLSLKLPALSTPKIEFTGLTLLVNDLNSIAHFYSKELGVDVRYIGSRELMVGQAVRFQENPGALFGVTRITLEFQVSDIAAVAQRVGHGPLEALTSFTWVDPAGHILHIRSISS